MNTAVNLNCIEQFLPLNVCVKIMCFHVDVPIKCTTSAYVGRVTEFGEEDFEANMNVSTLYSLLEVMRQKRHLQFRKMAL